MKYNLRDIDLKIEGEIKDSNYQNNSDWVERLVNIGISCFLLFLASPVLIVLAIIVKFQDQGPIFYKGIRYGQYKKEFNMYKFRTLVPNAEQIIGGQLLKSSMGLETPIGKLLRDTRLDELPQLWNVVNGDMALIGPRPERPAVYEKMCQSIPNYDLRFEMKPGLIGYSQLFTPHSANKRLRARIDNHYSRRESNAKNNYLFIIYSLSFLGFIAVKKIAKAAFSKIRLYQKVHRVTDVRASTRIKFFLSYYARLIIYINPTLDSKGSNVIADSRFSSFVFDVNDKYITVISDYKLPKIGGDTKAVTAKFIVHSPIRLFDRRKRRHIIMCYINDIQLVSRRTHYDGSYRYLLAYEPMSELYRYRIDKYVLKKSIL